EFASVLDRDSGLIQVRIDLSNPDSCPVGWLTLGNDISEAISKCLSALPDSEFQPETRHILESSYKPGVSPVNGFLIAMLKVFEGTGLLLIDPLQPEIRKLAQPTLIQAVRRNPEIRAAVLARSRALSDSGYHEQVKVDGNFTGLFAYFGKSRKALRPEELRDDLPLSANVLFRPVMQDAIFPTAAYVGGPAEVAYFGQAAAGYEVFGRPPPPV